MSASVGSRRRRRPPRLLDAWSSSSRAPAARCCGSAAARAKRAQRRSSWSNAASRVVTSANGRAVVPETHPLTLGAFNMLPEAEAIYRPCRSHDRRRLAAARQRDPQQTDGAADAARADRCRRDAGRQELCRRYLPQCRCPLDAEGLLERLPEKLDVDERISPAMSRSGRAQSEEKLAASLGQYRAVADALQSHVARGRHPFVRDVTLSNSTEVAGRLEAAVEECRWRDPGPAQLHLRSASGHPRRPAARSGAQGDGERVRQPNRRRDGRRRRRRGPHHCSPPAPGTWCSSRARRCRT